MENMKYSNFKNISINDLPIKFVLSNAIENYPKVLMEKEIKNLEDLFIAHDKKVFSDARRTGYRTISGICDILKNVYLGEVLAKNDVLETVIKNKDLEEFAITKLYSNLSTLGMPIGEQIIFFSYCVDTYKNKSLKEDTTIVEFMRSFYVDDKYQANILKKDEYPNLKIELQNLNFKIAVLLKNYKKKKSPNIINLFDDAKSEEISLEDEVNNTLSNKLSTLLFFRETLISQIQVVENQLGTLSDVEKIKKL